MGVTALRLLLLLPKKQILFQQNSPPLKMVKSQGEMHSYKKHKLSYFFIM